ncbi:Cytochrome c553 [Bosea lathyri]|uniref:Cytochrome c553 n=2 Tax=Bosea lathyri TaxID=1036778 RepID=A0A1H6C0J1_9HYPH|nr:Cytochrome c553 [Bosea lathyri]
MRQLSPTRAASVRMFRWTALAAVVLMGPAIAEPRQTLIEQCAASHGDDGIARDTEVPHLAGQNERYLVNQMLAFRSGKRAHKEMRFMARDMTTGEIVALAAYYAALSPR